ncbi:MAG: hypothetical protein OEY14_16810, partial [Myxococcales bacterium]|nr:hypothetical protein [Myxococcales bacterium]
MANDEASKKTQAEWTPADGPELPYLEYELRFPPMVLRLHTEAGVAAIELLAEPKRADALDAQLARASRAPDIAQRLEPLRGPVPVAHRGAASAAPETHAKLRSAAPAAMATLAPGAVTTMLPPSPPPGNEIIDFQSLVQPLRALTIEPPASLAPRSGRLTIPAPLEELEAPSASSSEHPRTLPAPELASIHGRSPAPDHERSGRRHLLPLGAAGLALLGLLVFLGGSPLARLETPAPPSEGVTPSLAAAPPPGAATGQRDPLEGVAGAFSPPAASAEPPAGTQPQAGQAPEAAQAAEEPEGSYDFFYLLEAPDRPIGSDPAPAEAPSKSGTGRPRRRWYWHPRPLPSSITRGPAIAESSPEPAPALPASPAREAIRAMLGAQSEAVRACAPGMGGLIAPVRVRIAPSGRITTAVVGEPLAGTPEG